MSNLAVRYDDGYNFSFTTPASGTSYSFDSGYDDGLQAVWNAGGKPSNCLMGAFHNFLNGTALGLNREQVLLSLEEIFKECSKENWDGYDAKPISFGAYVEAEKLINCLPMTLPMPEIVPEPTGEIALEWYKDKQFVFVISVSGNNVITYAGLFGKGNETHGTEGFFVDTLPMVIIRNIQRLYKVA